jgi:NADPH-dependent stearoyl-CoA 9-desaturase
LLYVAVQTTSPPPVVPDDPYAGLAAELDALGAAVRDDLGAADRRYITTLIAAQRGLEVAGRLLLLLSRHRTAQVAGAATLTLSKVLENMEIGHNVLHGQWDWMRDPDIQSSTWEWDMASTATSWRRAHNVQHHMWTNVLERDRDLGYSAMRVDPAQPWHPVHLLQPVYGVLMALTFDLGIAVYDMELDAVRKGTKTRAQANAELRAFFDKVARQAGKDLVLFPLLAGRRGRRRALAGVVAANVARNVWVHTIVFMGHLPEPARTYTEAEVAGETRGGWYARQLEGSCNLEGSRLFHLLTGHLSFQIEHHLFPDVPSRRLPQLAPHVRAACERHGLPYHSGRLGRQWRSVAAKVLRLSLPGA